MRCFHPSLRSLIYLVFLMLPLASYAQGGASLTIVTPANGSVQTSLNFTIQITASGFAPTQVSLFQGDLGSGTFFGTAPKAADGSYKVTANYPQNGQYKLYVQADNNGTVVTSPLSTFTIETGGGPTPSVAITQPANGSTLTSGTFTLTAVPSNGAPSSVAFFQSQNGSADAALGNGTGQPDGSFTKAVTVAASGSYSFHAVATVGGQQVVSPTVTYTVNLGGTSDQTVSVSSLSFNAELVNPAGFPTQQFTITNRGAENFSWVLSANVSWLRWSPGGGSLAPGASVTVTAWADPTVVSAGTLDGVLQFATDSQTGTTSQTLPVTFVATVTQPTNPTPLPSSQRYHLEATGGRLISPLINAFYFLFNYERVDESQAASTVSTVRVKNAGGVVLATFGPYTLAGRRGSFNAFTSQVQIAAGTYTAEFVFDDGVTVSKTFTIPDNPVVPVKATPTVNSFSDGSLTVGWTATDNAVVYSTELYQVTAPNTIQFVTNGGFVGPTMGEARLRWGWPAGMIQAGKTYRVWVLAYSIYPRMIPLPQPLTINVGESADFTMSATAPPFTGSTPTACADGPAMTISWTTTAPATSQVNYGIVGYETAVSNYAETTATHKVVLKGLDYGIPYHYQAYSFASPGSEWRSPDMTFTLPFSAAKPGDLNADGAVNVADAVLSLQFAVGLKQPTAAQRTAGDVNGDTLLNVADSVKILQLAVGLGGC